MTEQQFFSARDLWASQSPYVEPDRSTTRTVMREIMSPTFWHVCFGLTADAEVVTP